MSVFSGGFGRGSSRPSGIDLMRRPPAGGANDWAESRRSSASETLASPVTPKNRRRLARTRSIITSEHGADELGQFSYWTAIGLERVTKPVW